MRTAFRLTSALTLSFLFVACRPAVEDELQMNFVHFSPLEVDIVPDDTNLDGSVDCYISEEIGVELRLERHDNITEGQQRTIDVSAYELSYTPLNRTGNAIPIYNNGTAIHLRAGEFGVFPIRAVSFDQKTFVRDNFGADAEVNVEAQLILRGQDDAEEEFEVLRSFDIIFANFAEPDNCDGPTFDSPG